MSRIIFLATAMVGLMVAMWIGLQRLGWDLPALGAVSVMAHGPLMVGGFLGALIGLERAVALNRWWSYLTPALAGLGILALVLGAGTEAAAAITLASVGLIFVMVHLARRQPSLEGWVMVAGAVSWLAGNGIWLAGGAVPQAIPWWMGFVVLTIAGERLELNRILRLSAVVKNGFVGVLGLLTVGMLLSLVDLGWGLAVAGVALIGAAFWLLVYDVARRRLKAGGQARFIAVALLSGYGWLAVSGGLAVAVGGVTAGPAYDALVHTLFVGFAFAMIFGHAPIVFPAILRRSLIFTPRFYSHLLLLHLGLMLRLVGDLTLSLSLRQWGGLLNVLAILLFLFNTVTSLAVRGE